MRNLKIEFIKDRAGYKAGEIHDIPILQAKAFIEFKVAKMFVGQIQQKINFEDLTYKALQNLCKKKGISAVGKREDLISALEEVGV